MNELDNIPDDFWRKAFDGAEERPPQRVWDAVERQLDDDSKTRVLPLWGVALLPGLRTLSWGTGVAASVAILLVGWWYSHTVDQPKSAGVVVATVQADSETRSAPNVAQAIHSQRHAMVLAGSTPHTALGTRMRRTLAPGASRNELAFSVGNITDRVTDITGRYATNQSETHLQTAQVADVPQSSAGSVDVSPSISTAPGIALSMTVQASPVANQSDASSSGQLVANSSLRQAAQTKNTVIWADTEPVTDVASAADDKKKAAKREKWASISVMPGAYNPAVALASAPVAVAYTNNGYQNAVASAPTVESRSSRSVAYQLSAGIQLTERWSVESGVGYLTAQSTVESPSQVGLASVSMITAKDAQVTNNLFVDAIRSRVSSQANVYASADPNGSTQLYTAGRYSSAEQQSVSNDYQFVQVPVQVGYQLRPRKRLGLALIGGFLTNIFVRNTVANQVVVTSADDVYRSLSWAASLGARFRYRPSQHWSASLAGLYQPTLGNSTVSDSPIRSHPTSAGMSFGVDYHF